MNECNSGKGRVLLNRILSGAQKSYALICKADKSGIPYVEILCGIEHSLAKIAELDPLIESSCKAHKEKLLVVAPYRQITERGYVAIDDGAKLIVMTVVESATLSVPQVLALLPEVDFTLEDSHFDISDAEYERIVEKVIRSEIGSGEGANFVIKRTFTGMFPNYTDAIGSTIFKKLLRQEGGSYWTFLIRSQEVTLVGASPERHITLNDKSVSMTPISGTYRFPSSGPTCEGLIEFLGDEKEKDELSMVLDEELKMMTRICQSQVKAHGPYLTMMSRLAHTGYRLEGLSDLSITRILELSMFAPTIIGSPLENAARVIANYEREGRSYYSGFAALIDYEDDRPVVDSAILIRTAEIDTSGQVRIGAGATLVRDSDPRSETAETTAKIAALQLAMGVRTAPSVHLDAAVKVALTKRNDKLSRFWLAEGSTPASEGYFLGSNLKALIIDNEDAFTSMMEYQLKYIGLSVRIVHYATEVSPEENELLIIGPGPGDPCNIKDHRVSTSRQLILNSLTKGHPFIAICFGHQVLCTTLGFTVVALAQPNQGLQREISFFGKQEVVGFYNTFTALSDNDTIQSTAGTVKVSRDPSTGQVYGLQGANFCSMQYHPESILTIDGPRLLQSSIMSAVSSCSFN